MLFNGSCTEEFKPSRGIRQGDPISPYLLLLAAEGLSCLLKHAMREETITGIQITPTMPSINHLLFADDCMLFCKAVVEDATILKGVLNSYCDASGQRINNDKSSIYFGKGCQEPVRQQIKDVLEVDNETLKEKYLGLPSDVGKSKNGVFGYLKDRVWKLVQG